ncbi:MAG: type II toxin-antitoxin system VapC family toxin [Halobacteriales archaeon]|nr:type II toxin-antitoxin system VapC family toxin [Halobacteriales archaeon]
MAFDTSFLLDYLDGVTAARDLLNEHNGKPFFTPTLALFEVYRGAARTGGAEQIENAASALDWVEPLELTDAATREAALIESELLDQGEPVNLGDILIAGVCRSNGARVVTRDEDFKSINGLEVEEY